MATLWMRQHRWFPEFVLDSRKIRDFSPGLARQTGTKRAIDQISKTIKCKLSLCLYFRHEKFLWRWPIRANAPGNLLDRVTWWTKFSLYFVGAKAKKIQLPALFPGKPQRCRVAIAADLHYDELQSEVTVRVIYQAVNTQNFHHWNWRRLQARTADFWRWSELWLTQILAKNGNSLIFSANSHEDNGCRANNQKCTD